MVKPFLLTSTDQIKPPGMPAASSTEYARDIAEVRRLGGRTSTERTAEQSEVAVFWTVSTGLPYNAVARANAVRGNRTVIDNARLFALLNMAAADSQFVAWRIKYTQNVLRPVQAIREADRLGNPGIQADPHWEPMVVTPPHPDLAASCGEDRELRALVERLLRDDERGGGELDTPALGEAEPRVDPLIGRALGAWRLVARIGVGGMGVVYRAERSDGMFELAVAVKLLRPGVAGADALRRFDLERRTLAALSHPNIARLYDGGATPDGNPYLVMELVRGVPIDAYCDLHRLSVEARVRLFAQVCQAVHFAHTNLVVHRDLKPGNVLVDEAGVPKLVLMSSRM